MGRLMAATVATNDQGQIPLVERPQGLLGQRKLLLLHDPLLTPIRRTRARSWLRDLTKELAVRQHDIRVREEPEPSRRKPSRSAGHSGFCLGRDVADERNEVDDDPVFQNRVAERKVRVDPVAVVPTDLAASHVSRLLKISELALGGALGDRDEGPESEAEWLDCICVFHPPQFHARRSLELLAVATPVEV